MEKSGCIYEGWGVDSTGWKIARRRREREIWTSGDVGVERSEAIRMRFEF